MPPHAESEETNLFDYWEVLSRHKRLILSLFFGSLVLAVVYTVLKPKIYESTATILAPQEATSGGMAATLVASGLLNSMPGLSIPSLTPNRDVFLSILKSRALAADVVEQFHLQEHYHSRLLSEAIAMVQSLLGISVTKEGVLSIKFEDTDPQLAAQVANFTVSNLDRMLSRFGTTAASKQRLFIKERLAKTEADLKQAEEALARFQEKNNTFALQEQAKGAVEAAGKVKGEIIAAEVQLEVLRTFATDTNPKVVNLKRQVEEMTRQLAEMQYGKEPLAASSLSHNGEYPGAMGVAFSDFAELGLELARLTREVKVQEAVYSLLTQQLEQAKISEAKDMPTFQPLDKAVPADHRSKPSFKVNLSLAAFISLFAGVLLAFFLEYKGRVKRLPLSPSSKTDTVPRAPARERESTPGELPLLQTT